MNVSFATLSLTRNLQQLAAQIAALPAIHAALRSAMGEPDIGRFVQAKLDADRHIEAMAMTTHRLRVGVVGIDDLGPSLESLSELTLRAVRLVVLSELTMLRELRRAPSVAGLMHTGVGGPIGDIDAVDARLRDELDRITSAWWRYRGTPSIDRSAYRMALRAAHRATRALAEDREVFQFLDAGIARIDWPAFRESCTRVWSALLVRIDVEPDMALLATRWPMSFGLNSEHVS
jgi:hypothetical protein